MESEELRLLRENNIMLKQICQYLANGGIDNSTKDFIINFTANMLSDSINGKTPFR